MQKITPCFWFDGKAEEAAEFYTSIFNNSKITDIMRYGEEGPGKKGSVLTATFQLEDQEFMGLNGGPEFKFNPSISLFVNCDSEAEVDKYYKKLSEGATFLMEMGKYPFSDKYCWLMDKFGISWQLYLTGSVGSYGQKISPCLMFIGNNSGKAEEAIKFYTSLFKNSKIIQIARYEANEHDVEGTIKHATFTLEGESFKAMDSGLQHQFNFTPAISFFVKCKTQQEVDLFWDTFSKDGIPNRCGWTQDKYGVSWQIVPTVLGEMLGDPDKEKSGRVMKAMLKMDKLNIETLRQAYEKNNVLS